MKRICSIILTVCMLLTLAVPFTVSADEAAKGVTVSVDSAECKQGAKIDIPIKVTANTGFWGMQLELYYDQRVMRLDGVTVGDEFKDAMQLLENPQRHYPAVIQLMGNSLTENTATTGTLAVAHFFVYVGAQLGASTVSVETSKNNDIDVDGNEIPVTVSNFGVTVTEGLTSTDNPDDMPPKVTKPRPSLNKKVDADSSKKNSGSNSKTWLFFVIGGVVLLVVIILIWLFAGGDDDDSDEDKEAPVEAAPVPEDTVLEAPSVLEEAPAPETEEKQIEE